MEARQILRADLLDIVFDNRNKAYGAYSLRKNFNKRMWLAVGITLVFALASFLFFQPSTTQTAGNEVLVKEITLTSVKELPVTPPPVKEEAAPAKKTKKTVAAKIKAKDPVVKRTKFTTPIVKEKVTRNEVPAMDEIAVIDNITTDGIAVENMLPVPTVSTINGTGTETNGILMEKKPKKDDENKIFEKVEIEANVDRAKWRSHLERHLVRYIEDAAYAGMEPGTYTVMVRFLVEKDGSIGKATALNYPGYGLADGAVNVIKSGPKWSPGEQNGQKVRSFHTQPITFVIMEG